MSVEEKTIRCFGKEHLNLARNCQSDRDLAAVFSQDHAPEDIAVMIFAARWAQCAFPVLCLRGDQVSSLALTDSDPGKMEIRPPWPAFLVRIPAGAFPFRAQEAIGSPALDGNITGVCFVGYSGELRDDPGPQYASGFYDAYALTDIEGVSLNVGAGTLRELYSLADVSREVLVRDGLDPPAEAVLLVRRYCALAIRIVLSAIVAATAHGYQRPPCRRRPKGKRWVTIPADRRGDFVLGTPVTISEREQTEVFQAYLAGDSKILRKSRWLVRGHWRNQPHGPGFSQRKHIWIHPHWAGPESLPARVKEYRLGDDRSITETKL